MEIHGINLADQWDKTSNTEIPWDMAMNRYSPMSSNNTGTKFQWSFECENCRTQSVIFQQAIP